MRPTLVSMYNTTIRIPEAAVRLPLTFSSAKTKRLVPTREGSKGREADDFVLTLLHKKKITL